MPHHHGLVPSSHKGRGEVVVSVTSDSWEIVFCVIADYDPQSHAAFDDTAIPHSLKNVISTEVSISFSKLPE